MGTVKSSLKVDNVYNALKSSHKALPPTDSQLKVIDEMKQKLIDNDVDISFLAEPTDSKVASAIVRSLIRICKRHGLQ